MNNTILKNLLKEYDLKRQKAIQEAEFRKEQLYSSNPRLLEISNELNSISLSSVKAILTSSNKNETLKELEKKTNFLKKEKETILKAMDKEENYIYPQFECNLCKDTGYILENGNNSMCNCLKQKVFDIYYNKSNTSNLETENFEHFRSNLYSSDASQEQYASLKSPKENIEYIKSQCISFVENFEDLHDKNLIFTGGTGLGKTFLSNCIANEILKKGYTVLYQTAPIMFDTIIQSKFEKEKNNIDFLDTLLNVDLLIIDDLGTENLNSMKLTDLFTIINTRLLNQSHKISKTIISTNLSIENIFTIYNERIGSRLVGNYKFLRFFGEDLRFKKK